MLGTLFRKRLFNSEKAGACMIPSCYLLCDTQLLLAFLCEFERTFLVTE